MSSQLTPLQLIAGAGLAGNTVIRMPPDWAAAIDAYNTSDLITPLLLTLSTENIGNILTANTLGNLLSMGSNTCPALSDVVPLAQESIIGSSLSGFIESIRTQGNLELGNGDDSVFIQVFTGAEGYISSVNNYILTVNNSNTYLGSSFTSMNSLITGNLSDVNLALSAFGSDLANLGQAINLNNLDNLGSPLALLQQLSAVAGLTPAVIRGLSELGYDNTAIINSPPENLTDLVTLERLAYNVMLKIKNNDLVQVLTLLKVTTSGINTMADLLNPVKIFPQSFPSITVKFFNRTERLYVNSQGTVNSNLIGMLPGYIKTQIDYLSRIIPADQALANQSLRISLQQIKNISNIQLSDLAAAFLNTETTRDLVDVNLLTEPVPADVIAYYQSTFGTGSGAEGTLVINDVIGAASGIGYVKYLENVNVIINSLEDQSELDVLTEIYQRMNTTITGGYSVPAPPPDPPTVEIPPGPAQGSYASIDAAFANGLIPAAVSEINSIVISNPTNTNTLNDNYSLIAEKFANEITYLADANIDPTDLIPNQQSAILSFIQNLPGYGIETQVGGAAEYLESVADLLTLGGQAIVGSLRQGRNTAVLSASGIGQDIEIPNTYQQPPPQANLIPSTYTESEAANIVGN
jgi:hypothetical protein